MSIKEQIPESNPSATDTKDSPQYVLELEHIKLSFGNHVVLQDISLKLKHGENLVVMGKSGSGKSVLIKCIVGLVTPDEGIVKILEQDIAKLDEKQLEGARTNIGFYSREQHCMIR